MLVQHIIPVLLVAGLASAGPTSLPGGVEFFQRKGSGSGKNEKMAALDGVCQKLPYWASNGTFKMHGTMQCKIFFDPICRFAKYNPSSHWIKGPEGDDRTLNMLIDTSEMGGGDARNHAWDGHAFMCRSYFNNLLNSSE